jgi:hypothetical protein
MAGLAPRLLGAAAPAAKSRALRVADVADVMQPDVKDVAMTMPRPGLLGLSPNNDANGKHGWLANAGVRLEKLPANGDPVRGGRLGSYSCFRSSSIAS